MSAPIKPPAGLPDPSTAGVGAARPGPSTPIAPKAFREVVGTPATVPGAAAASIPQALQTIVQDLKSGRIDLQGAVDRLVARTTDRLGSRVSETLRAELESTLRDALQHDPTLQGLLKDLTRG